LLQVTQRNTGARAAPSIQVKTVDTASSLRR
jgi:hypothetical protein